MMVRRLMRGLGQVTRMSSFTSQVKTLMAKKVEGGPKILGVFVAATTNGEPLVESSTYVNITTIV